VWGGCLCRILSPGRLRKLVLWVGGASAGTLTALRAGNDYVLTTPSGTIRLIDYYIGLNQIEAIQTEQP
jgi:hypothetical protein